MALSGLAVASIAHQPLSAMDVLVGMREPELLIFSDILFVQ